LKKDRNLLRKCKGVLPKVERDLVTFAMMHF